MPANSSKSKSEAKATTRKSEAKATTRAKAAAPRPKGAAPRAERARAAAASAVDVPVGAVLEASDRVVELVEPFTTRAAAERRLKSYRTQLRRSVKRSERRGSGVRRRAADTAEQRVREVGDRLGLRSLV